MRRLRCFKMYGVSDYFLVITMLVPKRKYSVWKSVPYPKTRPLLFWYHIMINSMNGVLKLLKKKHLRSVWHILHNPDTVCLATKSCLPVPLYDGFSIFSCVWSQLLVVTATRTATTAVPADRGVSNQRHATDESIWATKVGDGGDGLKFNRKICEKSVWWFR